MTDTNMYDTLASTAQSFIHACRPSTPGTNTTQRSLILSHTTADFHMSWGHSYFISTFPPLQGSKTGDQWQDHMSSMAAKFTTWTIDITDMVVDVRKRKVVVRGDFNMTVRGWEEEGPVLNDILFVMRMDERGERLVECVEVVDPVASGEIGRRMREGKGGGE